MLYLLRVEVACLGATKASGFVSSQLGRITRCPSCGHRASMSDIPLSSLKSYNRAVRRCAPRDYGPLHGLARIIHINFRS
jgi:hypothetical protein